MKKKPAKFKLTNEVNRTIKALVQTLPPVPYFIKNPDGSFSQQNVKVGRKVPGSVLLQENPESVDEKGQPLNPTQLYIQNALNTRMMNHKVALIQAYEDLGDKGVQTYVAYVNRTYKSLQAQGSIIEMVASEKPAPKPEEFGWEPGGEDGSGVWTVDGGEQAYYKAMEEWEMSGQPVEKMDDLSTTEK